jgi:hypothetical protein
MLTTRESQPSGGSQLQIHPKMRLVVGPETWEVMGFDGEHVYARMGHACRKFNHVMCFGLDGTVVGPCDVQLKMGPKETLVMNAVGALPIENPIRRVFATVMRMVGSSWTSGINDISVEGFPVVDFTSTTITVLGADCTIAYGDPMARFFGRHIKQRPKIDTGPQTTRVLELARALSKDHAIRRCLAMFL